MGSHFLQQPLVWNFNESFFKVQVHHIQHFVPVHCRFTFSKDFSRLVVQDLPLTEPCWLRPISLFTSRYVVPVCLNITLQLREVDDTSLQGDRGIVIASEKM